MNSGLIFLVTSSKYLSKSVSETQIYSIVLLADFNLL